MAQIDLIIPLPDVTMLFFNLNATTSFYSWIQSGVFYQMQLLPSFLTYNINFQSDIHKFALLISDK